MKSRENVKKVITWECEILVIFFSGFYAHNSFFTNTFGLIYICAHIFAYLLLFVFHLHLLDSFWHLHDEWKTEHAGSCHYNPRGHHLCKQCIQKMRINIGNTISFVNKRQFAFPKLLITLKIITFKLIILMLLKVMLCLKIDRAPV